MGFVVCQKPLLRPPLSEKWAVPKSFRWPEVRPSRRKSDIRILNEASLATFGAELGRRLGCVDLLPTYGNNKSVDLFYCRDWEHR